LFHREAHQRNRGTRQPATPATGTPSPNGAALKTQSLGQSSFNETRLFKRFTTIRRIHPLKCNLTRMKRSSVPASPTAEEILQLFFLEDIIGSGNMADVLQRWSGSALMLEVIIQSKPHANYLNHDVQV
jgi:hypothetical protein